jgi:D-3-phosphoglycerate dehydrogenase
VSTARRRILLIDPNGTLGSPRELLGDHDFIYVKSVSELPLADLAIDAVFCSAGPFTARLLASMASCRIISRSGIGVNDIDLDAASAAGILVANVPDFCIDELSDHVIGFLLAFTRGIFRAGLAVRSGVWSYRTVAPLRRIRGLRLGLVGFGRSARAVVPKARALGLNVLAYDPYVEPDVFEINGVSKAGFNELLSEADFVSVHAPLSASTRHLIGRDEFARMKPSVVLINISRGSIIDEQALIDALRTGRIAGAALDVMETEPPADQHPLRSMPNVILTPHIAGYTEEAVADAATKAAAEIRRVLSGEMPVNLVNPAAMETFRKKWERT